MADKDYYSILGLSESDKQLHGKEFNDKISKEFRKLSLKWHPDRWVNGTDEEKKTAEEKFKEIAEAYSVLSDEEKRAEYDNGGLGPDPFQGFDPFENLRRAGFGAFNFHFGGSGFGGPQNRGPRPINGTNVLIDVSITLKEAYEGCVKTVTYTREQECPHCHGTGSENGKTKTCTRCNGTGQMSRTNRQGNVTTTYVTQCPYCGGSGVEPTSVHCHECNGVGYKTVTETKDIPVPKGVDNGTTMGYGGLGNPGKFGGADGSLEVRFTIKEDEYFQRRGSELTHIEEIPIVDALLGTSVMVNTIDGKTIEIKVPELTESGYTLHYPNRGMPTLDRYGRNGINGDYYVVIKYKLPKKLTKKQKDLLKQFKQAQ